MVAKLHAIVPYIGSCPHKLQANFTSDPDDGNTWFEIPANEPVIVMGYGHGWAARVIYDGVDAVIPHPATGLGDLVDLFEPV